MLAYGGAHFGGCYFDGHCVHGVGGSGGRVEILSQIIEFRLVWDFFRYGVLLELLD